MSVERELLEEARGYMGHTCAYGSSDSPEADFCTCGIAETRKRIREVLSKPSPATFTRDDLDAAVADAIQPWRELLWLNHARYTPYTHMPYGDDGEMQCCGIDFKRASADEIRDYLSRRATGRESA